MTNDAPRQLERSIEIDATPEEVWALVTDLPRMASWSPQVVRTTIAADEIGEGVRFTNLNRQWKVLHWPTKGKVVRFEPYRDFAFRIAENRTIWSFELTPTATGTKVVQRREVPDGISVLSIALTTVVLGGVGRFTDRLERGMDETLARIKADAERATAA
ncbi:MAG: polyketide cyclase [Nocardioides sp.]|nr:polyketide cyclase [Nocardioides sp.]